MKLNNKNFILLMQSLVIILFIGLWELFSRLKIINSFLISSPSEIIMLTFEYLKNGNLLEHIQISLIETTLGLIIGTALGIICAILLWFFPLLVKIFDPFLVMLNALPKTAIAPILIIWAGTGMKGIIVVSISLSLAITIISGINYFINIDANKYKMMKILNANKIQILFKLVLPSNVGNIFNIIKINIGLSWIGVIVGEFLVSRSGIGYLVIYGSQVFRMDIVMMGVLILCLLSLIMYLVLNIIEKIFYKITHFKPREKHTLIYSAYFNLIREINEK